MNKKSHNASSLSVLGAVTTCSTLLRRTDRLRLLVLLVLLFVAALVELAGLASIQYYMAFIVAPETAQIAFLDPLLAGRELDAQIMLMTGFLALVLLAKLGFFSLVYYVIARTVTAQRITLSDTLFRAYLRAPTAWHKKRPSAELQRNVRDDVNAIVDGVVITSIEITLSIVIGVAILGYVLAALPLTVVACLVGVAGLLYLVAGAASRTLVRAGAVRRREQGETVRAIQQGFGSLAEARILGRLGFFEDTFRNVLDSAAPAQRTSVFVLKGTPVLIETVVLISLLVIIAIIVRSAESIDAALATSTVLAAAAFRLKQVFNKIANCSNKLSQASPAVRPMAQDLAELAGMAQDHLTPVARHDRTAFDTFRFEDVSFLFPDADRPAVDRVSFSFDRGSRVAVVGKTGAGKSTLLDLVLGLVPPDSGAISVNGVALESDLAAWRSRIGYVPQSVYLIDDTIAANVALGIPNEKIDRNQVARALELARLADHVGTLPRGIDTPVGEQGTLLSGGQRQRIGIARALYADPEILILDEATSALDRQTEASILDALDALSSDVTLLAITHRVETLSHFDRVLFIDAGRLVADGPVDAVAERSPAFRSLTQTAERVPA